MTFLYPAMLAGLIAVAVPAVLHLIARQRFPVENFPSIMLIQSEQRTNTYAMRPVDLLQLLLRMLLVAAVVLALTRPTLLSSALGRSARNIVVVLDCSPSMLTAAEDAPEASLFLQAREQAVEMLLSAGPHDRVAYIEAGTDATIVSPLSADPQAVADQAGRSAVQYQGGSSIAEAIATACSMLATRREYSSEIYVLSDMRQNILDGWDDLSQQALAQARQKLGDRLKLRFIDLAPKDLPNVGIVDVRLTPGRISTASDAHLIATVRNVADEEKEVTVNLLVRSLSKTRRTITVPAASEAIVDVATTFDTAMNTWCRLQLESDDSLPVDDDYFVPIRMDRRFEVLIIDGTEQDREEAIAGGGAEPPQTETGLSGAKMLEYALNPAQFAASEGRGRTRNSVVKSVTTSAINTAMIGTSDLVVLYNVGRLPQRTMQDLQDLVKNGRSLLIIPSDDVNLISLRSSFVHPPEGMIPLSPAEVNNAAPVEPGTKVELGEDVHPVMEPFLDLMKGDLGTVNFKRLRELVPVEGADIIFRVGGRPAAVEMRANVPGDTPEQAVRRGRVCVLGFGLEPSWSNLALTRVFVPLIWRLTDHAAGRLGSLPVDVARAGERLVLEAADFMPAPYVSLFAPDGTPLRGPDGWPIDVPLSESGSAVINGLADLGPYMVTMQGQVDVEVALADSPAVTGSAYTAAVRDAIRGKVQTISVRRPGAVVRVSRDDAAGGSFARAVTVRGLTLKLGDGNALACDVAAGDLDAALAAGADEVSVRMGNATRTISVEEVKGGSFAAAFGFAPIKTIDRKTRFVCVNPPAGETDTQPIDDAALERALGPSGWEIVPAKEATLAELNAGELWYYLAIVLLLAYFAEGLIGHVYSYRREQTRAG